MNKWQEHNKNLVERHKDQIHEGSYRWYSHQIPAREGGDCFACVECGEDCSTANFKFYNKDPLGVKCWNCQNGGQ